MDYSRVDLDKADADLAAAERRRKWMSDVVMTLNSRNHSARIAERQLATFAAMTATMQKHRQDIEEAIVSARQATAPLDASGDADHA